MNITNHNHSVLIIIWLWSLHSTGRCPPWHRGEDSHALSHVRYSSLVWKPWGKWDRGTCYVVQHGSAVHPWELSQLDGALQVVSGLEKVTLSWTLIKTSFPQWQRSSQCLAGSKYKHLVSKHLYGSWLLGVTEMVGERMTESEEKWLTC